VAKTYSKVESYSAEEADTRFGKLLQQQELQDRVALLGETKADKQNTYDRLEMDDLLALKGNKEELYSSADMDKLLEVKASRYDTYSRSEMSEFLSKKANRSEVYTTNEVKEKLALKIDKSELSMQAKIVAATRYGPRAEKSPKGVLPIIPA